MPVAPEIPTVSPADPAPVLEIPFINFVTSSSDESIIDVPGGAAMALDLDDSEYNPYLDG